MEKKLIYVINRVDERDVTHLFHVLNLIDAMRHEGWEVTLLSERGGHGIKMIGGHEVTYLSQSGYLTRTIGLVWYSWPGSPVHRAARPERRRCT